ncbi:MAG TPA: ectonucleotide pyrophosphatase/phosphodiesterase [Bryobacteraceae bacterium]|nr:ectonucleotide pyrophosphatase/phosphodiesterase [Bryobacteraceae bacterium]
MRRIAAVCAGAFLLAAISDAAPRGRSGAALLVVSIDGMHPDYVREADRYGSKIPNLRRIYREGAHARSVRGVLPTVTYPSHTTMLTGASPARHGIYQNTTFDPAGVNRGGWYWYSEDIRVPTLWEAAAAAGYTVASVSWPVSVGARGVKYLIPEYWRAFTPDDLKLVRALSTPGLMAELEGETGPWINDLDQAVAGDWRRTRYTEALIRRKNAEVVTLHLAALDHLEHASGPYAPDVLACLEEIDAMVGLLVKAMAEQHAGATVCIVSDHGFAKIDHEMNPGVALAKAGLLKLEAQAAPGPPQVTDWKVQVWSAGGSAAIVLKDPNDTTTRDRVKGLLTELAADPANGVAAILDRADIARMGGAPNAEFFIDMKPGFSAGGRLEGGLVRSRPPGGTHGYAPGHGEMSAAFLIAGPAIRKGADAGDIDMRSIGPTLARVLGVPLPAAEMPALDGVFASPR